MNRVMGLLLLLGVLTQARETQLKIVADHFSGDEKKNISRFEGNVRISMDSDELNASNVTVELDDDRRPLRYIAEGDVSFYLKTDDNATYKGRANKVVFSPEEEEYRFYKDVHLMQLNEHKQIDGDEVIVNIKAGTATAKGDDKKPVIMIFTLPEKKAEQ